MRTASSRVVTAALLTACLGVTLSLTSCSALSGRDDHEWKTAKQMTQSADGGSVPTLVASDAENIRFSAAAIGSGPTVITWQSKSGITRDDCKVGSIQGAPSSSVPKWWPGEVPSEGWSCGWWRVFQKDGSYYTWQQRDSQA